MLSKRLLLLSLCVLLAPASALSILPDENGNYEWSGNYGYEVESFGPVVGIEFGATHSRIAIFTNNNVSVLTNDRGFRETPSVVAFTDEGTLVGLDALELNDGNPKNTIYDIRNLIGKKPTDHKINEYINGLSYDVVESKGKLVVQRYVDGKTLMLTPEEIAAEIFRKLKDDAESFVGNKVTHAVVTVPSYFNDNQRQAVKNAGAIAGLNILRFVNEPTAACISYGIDKDHTAVDILVYNIGTKTSEVTVESIDRGVFEVLAEAHDDDFGGKDFEDPPVDDNHDQEYKVKIDHDSMAMKLQDHKHEKTEQAILQSAATKKDVQPIENFGYSAGAAKGVPSQVSKSILLEKSLELIKKVLKNAKVQHTGIGLVVLSGSPEHIAHIQPSLKVYFGENEFGTKFQTRLSGDAIVWGAAMQAAVLGFWDGTDDCGPGLLPNVNPLSLGVQTSGGLFTKIIPRNNIIPIRKTRVFSTSSDNQATIKINILEGERLLSKHNNLLGTLELTGIPLAKRGVPEIEISFEIDANDRLKVVTIENESKKEAILYVDTFYGTNTQDGIDVIIVEAEMYYEEDLTAKETMMRDGVADNGFGIIEREP